MPGQVAQKRQGRLRARLYLGCGITLRCHQQVIIDKAKLPPISAGWLWNLAHVQ